MAARRAMAAAAAVLLLAHARAAEEEAAAKEKGATCSQGCKKDFIGDQNCDLVSARRRENAGREGRANPTETDALPRAHAHERRNATRRRAALTGATATTGGRSSAQS